MTVRGCLRDFSEARVEGGGQSRLVLIYTSMCKYPLFFRLEDLVSTFRVDEEHKVGSGDPSSENTGYAVHQLVKVWTSDLGVPSRTQPSEKPSDI